SALDERGVTPSVLRVRGGVVERVPVEVLLRDDASERIAIEGALAAGDTVLTGAAQGITPGTRVRVGQPAGAPGDSAPSAQPVQRRWAGGSDADLRLRDQEAAHHDRLDAGARGVRAAGAAEPEDRRVPRGDAAVRVARADLS